MLKAWKKPFLPLISYFGRLKAEKHFTDEPILIGGCGRSGTTILLSIISAHPEVFASRQELGLFNKVKTMPDGRKGPHRIDRLYRTVLFNKIPHKARRIVEKSPSNVNQIGAIKEYFRNRFKFIHIIRDGRDVVLSIHPTDPNRYWVDPARWVNDVSNGLAYRDDPNVLTIFYEDLMQDYPRVIREICQHCELSLTNELENWFAHTKVKHNRAFADGARPIHTQSIGKWKKPEHRERVQEFLSYPGAKALMQELGYLSE